MVKILYHISYSLLDGFLANLCITKVNSSYLFQNIKKKLTHLREEVVDGVVK